jgi:hypothetical protein
MIKTVIRLNNDLVMVFDENGEQMHEYQGKYNDVKYRILSCVSPDTKYIHWYDAAADPKTVSLEKW